MIDGCYCKWGFGKYFLALVMGCIGGRNSLFQCNRADIGIETYL